MSQMTQIQQRRYPDSIETSDGKTVRLSTLRPNQTIRIGRSRTAVKVKDIPITAALLKCGHIVRGIAFAQGDVVFCEEDHEDMFVEEVLSSS